MGIFKWIVKQPKAAGKFLHRHAKTKTGRAAMILIGTTAAQALGGEQVAEHIPEVVDAMANPTTAAFALLAMYLRDKQLKDAETPPQPKRRAKK